MRSSNTASQHDGTAESRSNSKLIYKSNLILHRYAGYVNNNIVKYFTQKSTEKMFRYEILGLYKSLLRYSQNLKYTDKKYFVHRVRKGFLNNRFLTNEQDIEFQHKKGLMVLKHKRVI